MRYNIVILLYFLKCSIRADAQRLHYVCDSLRELVQNECPTMFKFPKEFPKAKGQWGVTESGKYLIARGQFFESGTGLGNRLFGALSSMGIAWKMHRQPIFSIRNEHCNVECKKAMWELTTLFPGIIPDRALDNSDKYLKSENPEIRISQCCLYDDPLTKTNLILDMKPAVWFYGDFLQSYKYFYGLRKMYEPILKAATTETFITEVLKNFANDSTQFFLFGDDMGWLKNMEPRLKQQADHLHVLDAAGTPPVAAWHFASKYCDKVVITAGSSTFGWWAGYFAQMHRSHVEVYYNKKFAKSPDYLRQQKDEDYYLPNWKPLDLLNGDD
ncbi:unnamed protein product, partial [Mesorhabditis spiculigera]